MVLDTIKAGVSYQFGSSRLGTYCACSRCGLVLYITQTSASVNKRKSMVKINPKSTIEIFNKAIEICRDLATFISTCG